jgi:hypothetical protein
MCSIRDLTQDGKIYKQALCMSQIGTLFQQYFKEVIVLFNNASDFDLPEEMIKSFGIECNSNPNLMTSM